jgi:hypothetical protein
MVDILFQHIKFRTFKDKSQVNNDIFSEWRKSLSKGRKWLSKVLFLVAFVSGSKIPSPQAPGICKYGGHLKHFATLAPGSRYEGAPMVALYTDQT